MAKVNRTREIVDTMATLENYPAQRDDAFTLVVYRNLILAILPLLEMDASAEEIASAMCRECPKFGS